MAYPDPDTLGCSLNLHSIESEAPQTKRSKFERERRTAESARVAEIERAWRGSIPKDVAAQFDAQVRAVKERGPLPPPPNQPPGTIPNPPKVIREPKAPKADDRSRRGR
jgi:hypothetical protein